MKVFNIFDFLEPKQEKDQDKEYSYKEIKDYVLVSAYNDDLDDLFKLSITTQAVLPKGLAECYKSKSLEKEYENFKEVYNSFCWHLFNDKLKIISYKKDDEYHLLYIPKNDPFIVETTPVKDLLTDYTCAPACAITWYNKDGTFATDYLNYRDGEELTKEIRQPKSTKQMCYAEYYKDRREYYFFNVLKVHKFGKNDRVSANPTYDSFTNYRWRLIDITNYFGEGSVE